MTKMSIEDVYLHANILEGNASAWKTTACQYVNLARNDYIEEIKPLEIDVFDQF